MRKSLPHCPDQLGMKLNEQQGIRVKSVLRGSAAEQAGFAAGDEWLGVATRSRQGRPTLAPEQA